MFLQAFKTGAVYQQKNVLPKRQFIRQEEENQYGE